MTSSNLLEADIIESSTAKGLRLEYMMIGENIIASININPGGPINNLYQGGLPNYFILNIYA
jgi:hypothetical protein